MSAFTESALIKKLLELNSSQQSIQTLSLWLIHHRKHHVGIVRVWYRELQKATQGKKLTLMYLANDVIQNSKKKGPEYGKEFGGILQKVFQHIGETCDDEKLLASLSRILKIWEDRGVFEVDVINGFRKALRGMPIIEPEKRKPDEVDTSTKRARSLSGSDKKDKSIKSETIEVNGKLETHVTLSPHVPIGDPPEPEELIKALTKMDNAASTDAALREKIVNLPPNISDISALSQIGDKEAALAFSKKVNEAVDLIHDYNAKLVIEMDDRKKLESMLRNFQAEQRELLAQAEQRLEEYTKKLRKIKEVQMEIRDHLSNLPDLTQLPDVTGGLAPLPSAGDLFNIH